MTTWIARASYMRERAGAGGVFTLHVYPCFDMSIAKLNEMKGLTLSKPYKS